MRHGFIMIAVFMCCEGLKMMVCRSNMACGGEMVLVARHLDFRVGHYLFLRVELNAPKLTPVVSEIDCFFSAFIESPCEFDGCQRSRLCDDAPNALRRQRSGLDTRF